MLLITVVVGCGERRSDHTAATERPERGGQLRMIVVPPQTLDPIESTTVYSSFPINQVFDGLVARNAMLQLRPGLAESWEIDRSGRRYRFHLRRGVRFHDGRLFDAADVVYSWTRVLAPDAAGKSLAFGYLSRIEGADAFAAGEADRVAGLRIVDDHTLDVHLTARDNAFLQKLTMDGAMVLPRPASGDDHPAEFFRRPVGTGPFRLVDWQETGLGLLANDDYFAGRPHLDEVRVTFAQAADDVVVRTSLTRAATHAAVPQPALWDDLESFPHLKLRHYQELSVRFLGLKGGAAPLDRPWLRQAIAMSIDRDRLIEAARDARSAPVGILPPGVFGFTPEQKLLPFDPAGARLLLAEQGHPDGADLPEFPLFTTVRNQGTNWDAGRIVRDLAQVGIRVEPHVVDWPEMMDRLRAEEPALFVLSWIADTPDPDSFLRTLFEPGASGNYWGHDDDRSRALLTALSVEPDARQRRELYRQLERNVLELAPVVPLFHLRGALAMVEDVRGLTPGALGVGGLELEHAWLRDGGRS